MKSGGKCGQGRGEVRRKRMGVDLIKTHDAHVQNSQTIKKINKKYFLPRQSDAILKEAAKFPSQLKQFFRQPSHLHRTETIPILSN